MPSKDDSLRVGWGAPLTVFFFLICLYCNSYQSDLDYWTRWMNELGLGGYASVKANYPPLLLHWFWFLAKLFKVLGLTYPPESMVLLKFIVLIPVLIIQVWLSVKVEKALVIQSKDPLKSPLFWGVVCSPAMLLDGAIWGQVDLLPFIPLWVSLVYAFRKQLLFSGIAFAIALMCKFQAIVLLPLLGGLWLRAYKKTPCLLAGFSLTGILGFLPFIVVGRFGEALRSAYWGNLNIYPYSTYNAANLWYIISGNNTNVNTSIFNVNEGVLSQFTPHHIGFFIFTSVSLFVMYRALFKIKKFDEAIQLSLVLILCFFAFGPSMHERYLFLLVPFTALGYAKGYIKGEWFALASVVVALNINLILNIRGSEIWILLSWIITALALVSIWTHGMKRPMRLPSLGSNGRFGVPLALVIFLIYSGAQGMKLYKLKNPDFNDEGTLFLSDMMAIEIFQAYGELGRDESLTKSPLNIFEKNFTKGLGVHAKSKLTYKIPKGAKYFHAFYGLDQNGKNGNVEFKVELDGNLSWKSGDVKYQTAKEVWIDLKNAQKLILIVDPLVSNAYDHADWAEASFRKNKP